MNQLGTKYTVVSGSDPVDLENRVNALLENGWELRGELHLNIAHNNDLCYHQVMILNKI